MLQWMGGSRRKVTTSRTSTQYRQKQYFEQKKRRQQTPGQDGVENSTDIRNRQSHYIEEPRSLDILSLANLTSAALQDKSINRSGSEPRTIYQTKISSPSGSQNPSATYNSRKPSGQKVPVSPSVITSNKADIKLPKQEDAQNDVTILDLLADDEHFSNLEGRPLPEDHVAFSVEGEELKAHHLNLFDRAGDSTSLGKVGTETPVHSPRQYRSGFPSTPKAFRRIQSVKHQMPIPYDIRHELNAMMQDIEMSQDRSSSVSHCKSRGIFDDLVTTKSTKYTINLLPDAYENLTQDCDNEEETFKAYKDGRKEQHWNAGRVPILEENFLDEMKYDATWIDKSFHPEGNPSFSLKAKKSETHTSRFGDTIPKSRRSVFEERQSSDYTASYAPYTKHLRQEIDFDDCVSFGWERPRADNSTSGFDSLFSPPEWSPFLATEDSQDTTSLLSEESCSSTVREEKNYDFGLNSVKLKDGKINRWDKFCIGSNKKNKVKNFSAGESTCTGLDGAPRKDNLSGTENYKSLQDQWTSKAGYCSEYSSPIECISLSKRRFTSAQATSIPSSYHPTPMEVETGFVGNLVTGENLFNMFPVSPMHPTTTEFENRRSKSKITDDHDPSTVFISRNDVMRQQSDPGVQMKNGLEGHFPYYHADDPWRDPWFSAFSKQREFPDESIEDRCIVIEKPLNKDSAEKKSSSSVNGEAATVTNCKSIRNEHEESKGENQEPSDGPTRKAGESPIATVEVTAQPASCIDGKLDYIAPGSPVPSRIKNEDSAKEKIKTGGKFEGEGGKDASYQVMLERSYVLQLLSVQKVLMGAIEKDARKPI